jgi:hypothetical protein
MQKRSKRILAATLAAAGVMAAAGTAWAVFAQSATSSDVQASANTFAAVTVTGAPVDTSLWPNQTTNVALTIQNPNDVDVIVTSVEPVALTAADVTLVGSPSAQDIDFCRTKVQTIGIAAPSNIVIGASASGSFTITGGLKLLEAADNRCQGMTIRAKWTVGLDTHAV